MGGSSPFSVFLAIATLLLCFSNISETCFPSEKQALTDFKKDLKDPSGRLSSWVDNVDCCQWEAVVCSNRSGHVIQLRLQNSDYGIPKSALSGNISHSLQNLTHLRYLDLSVNDFSGIQIPRFLGSLKNLRYLNLSGAGFQGMVPHQLGNLSSLRTLSVDNYGSTLQVDNLQWLTGLSNLKHLDMSELDLHAASNWLELINMIPSLVELHLHYCYLPQTSQLVYTNLSSLTILDLSGNFFSSSIPRWIFGLTALVSLDLSWNGLMVPWPRGPWNFTSLKNLDLSRNGLSGSLPRDLFKFNYLESLYLGYNFLDGSLDGNWNWSSLKYLELTQNNFNSFLPNQLSTLSGLISLDLAENCFQGSIPRTVANISKLQFLFLSNNNLSSSLPDELFTLHDLTEVAASLNHLSGPIPSTVGNSTKLKFLDLTGNKLSSAKPGWLYNCPSLQALLLSGNQLQGAILDNSQLGNSKNLWKIDLTDNAISGSLPLNLGSLSSLEEFYIGYNKFTGTLPESLGQLSKLESLSIVHNLMEGIVSESALGNLTSLRNFDASENSLTLKVSASWIPHAQFDTLGLAFWNLGPQFPTWLHSQKSLWELNLSSAGISDTIPSWLFSLSINSVDLSRNQLHGGISQFLCEVENETQPLYYLDLGENSLSGEIPDCWTNHPSMGHINLNSNNFTGSIPRSLFYLEYLDFLNLRNNSLTGPIPLAL